MDAATKHVRELGAVIRARRREVGLSGQQVAARSGVSRRLLVELENGKRPNVSLAALVRVMAVLGLDLQVRPRGLPGTRGAGDGRPLDV